LISTQLNLDTKKKKTSFFFSEKEELLLMKNTGSFNEIDELITWFWYAKMFFGPQKITKNLFDRKNI